MIRSSLLLLPLLVAPLGLAPVSSFEAPAAQEDTALQTAMGVFKKEQRSLKKLIADPAANEQAILASLKSMEAAALVAIAEAPPYPEGLAGKPLERFKVGYKSGIADLLSASLAMQGAALRGDGEALKTGYDKLSAGKKSGHQEYRDF